MLNGVGCCTVAILSVYSRHRQSQRVKGSPVDRSLMSDTDAGQSSASFKRDANRDAEEAFLLHASWNDIRHGVPPHQANHSSAIVGQYWMPVSYCTDGPWSLVHPASVSTHRRQISNLLRADISVSSQVSPILCRSLLTMPL